MLRYATRAVWESVLQRGLFATVAMLWHELWFDLRRGTSTTRTVDMQSVSDVVGENQASSTEYHAVNPLIFRRCIDEASVDRKATFVDYGCGKGRALILAGELGFAKIVGVEFSEGLCAIGRQNLAKVGSPGRIDHADACTWPIPDGPCAFFLFNPFGPDVLGEVARNIRRSWDASPRPLWILYANPLHADALTAAGFTAASTGRGDALGYRIFREPRG
jgi:SAM-dependent methyltransferase